MSTTKRRSHKNDKRRLTAKERANQVTYVDGQQRPEWPDWVRHRDVIERALQAHAREAIRRAVIRYRRKHPTQDDIRAALEPVIATRWRGK